MDSDLILPGLPAELILAAYRKAPGKEIESGKFASPESSAALAANTFGLFIDESESPLLRLPEIEESEWPAEKPVMLEQTVRFPWSGGLHPFLDALIITKSLLVGVESKRFEPFRDRKVGAMSDAYSRPVWGNQMKGYEDCRDRICRNDLGFERLDAAQLVKHAFGLRTAAHKKYRGKKPVLYYLYAEPERWPNGVAISDAERGQHRAEIDTFSRIVSTDEVRFLSCSYKQLLAAWSTHADAGIRAHAAAIAGRFAP